MGETGVKTLMIAGGGTGGHIYPAVAIAREYVSRDASRKVVFVGTERGLEKTIVPKAGFPLEFIDVAGLKGKSGLDLVSNVLRVPLGFVQAWQLISKHRPNVVLGVGGYSSGPVLVAAGMRGIPTIIHESNAFPGLTNRILAQVQPTVVAVAFAPRCHALKRKDGVVTGQSDSRRSSSTAARRPAPRPASVRHRLLVFGGSQGSRVLNDAMTGALLFLARAEGQAGDRPSDRSERPAEGAGGVSHFGLRGRARRAVSRPDGRRDRGRRPRGLARRGDDDRRACGHRPRGDPRPVRRGHEQPSGTERARRREGRRRDRDHRIRALAGAIGGGDRRSPRRSRRRITDGSGSEAAGHTRCDEKALSI